MITGAFFCRMKAGAAGNIKFSLLSDILFVRDK